MELFILKLLDCILGTTKSILLYKNKVFMSALTNSIATFFYLTMMVQIVKVDSVSGKVVICIATFLGTLIAMYFAKMIEKDKVYVFNVTPDTNENGKMFADEVRENNIPILTYKGYGGEKEQVLCCKIFSENKEQSKLIENIIPSNFKYHVYETKNSIAA